jgi:mono/diheme cytochrome c family protein
MRKLLWGVLAALLGCAPTKTTIVGSDDVPQDQWSRGVYLYGQHCAGCHGEAGAGDEETPPLVGEAALPLEPRAGSERSTPFRHAADVFAFVKESMPPLEPHGVNDRDTWAILAMILKDNGVAVPDPLGPDNAATVPLR